MLSNMSKLESKIGNKVYQLICDQDSPLNHVKESLCHFIAYVNNLEEQIKAAQAQIPVTPPISDTSETTDPVSEQPKQEETCQPPTA